MLHTTIKSLLAHKLRLAATAAAVVLGVAFMAGTLVLTDTVGRTFDDLFADVYDGTDAVVRSSDTIESDLGTQRGTLPADLVATVAGVDGVAAAEPHVEGFAQFVGSDGEPVGDPQSGAPTFGMNWVATDALRVWDLAVGEAPLGPGEVAVDKATADAEGFAPGDEVEVLTLVGPRAFTVSGVVTIGSVDSPAGATVALFDTTTAQEVLGTPGTIDGISVEAADGVGEAEVTAAVAAALPDGAQAVTGAEITAENQNEFAEALSFFSTFLLTFAVIALVVGGFMIHNTFTIVVAQRSREMALLRAVGASRRQVLASVVLEAGIVAVVASAVGVVAGVGVASGLKALLAGFGVEVPAGPTVLEPRTVVVGMAVGVVVTLVAVVVPAIRASRLAPVAALTDVAVETTAAPRWRTLAGIAALSTGLVAVGADVVGSVDGPVSLLAVGALGLVAGVVLVGPALAPPLSRVLGRPLQWRGVTGQLAVENATRSPRRTASTATALTIGVAVVAATTILAASATASVSSTVEERFTGDFVIDAGGAGLPPEVMADVLALDEVAEASAVRAGVARLDGDDVELVAVDVPRMEQIFDIGVSSGDLGALDVDGIAVSDATAEAEGWTIGTLVDAEFLETGPTTLEVVATYEADDLVGGFLAGLPLVEAHYAEQVDVEGYVLAADGVAADDVRAAIDGVLAAHPGASVMDLGELKAEISGQINQLLGLVYALLGLAVLIALLGIANTLALSTHERTRELGLLRAVGMSRGQLRSSMRWEAALIAAFGALTGLVLGGFLGWAVFESLADEGFTTLDVPAAQILVIGVGAAAAGVLAALLPARRAARLDILGAIATS